MTTLFAHRGFVDLHKGIRENTIESLNEAVRLGFKAIEFDIWLANQKLVITHDDPKGNIKDLPTQKEYFKFGNKIKYWMDFKNMNETNVDEIILLLKDAIIAENIDLEQLYFVPCNDDYNKTKILLQKIRSAFGDKANFAAFCRHKEKMSELINFISRNNVKFVSLQYELINEKLIQKLKDITIFAWTVNDITKIRYLESLKIENFATDKIMPGSLELVN